MSQFIKEKPNLGKLRQIAMKNFDKVVEFEADGMRFRLICLGSVLNEKISIKELKHKIKMRAGLSKKERAIAIKAGLIDKDQEWFSTTIWQKKERDADEAIRKGEVIGPFENDEEAIRALKRSS